jgi:hypothetical protein
MFAGVAHSRDGTSVSQFGSTARVMVSFFGNAHGNWALGVGRWALGVGRWALGVGR